MKRILTAVVLLIMVLCASANAAHDEQRGPDKNAGRDMELLLSRSVILWIDGRQVADLMVGATAKIEFVLVDKKLARRIYDKPDNFPEAIVWNASDIDKAARAKCSLIIMPYRALNWWEFDPQKITVNGEPIPLKRFTSGILSKSTGRLAPDEADVITFGVPRSMTKPGSTLVFGYEGYSVELKVPSER